MVVRPREDLSSRNPGNSFELVGPLVLNQYVVRAEIGLKLGGVPQRGRVAFRLQECFSVRSACEQHTEVAVEVGFDQLGRGELSVEEVETGVVAPVGVQRYQLID